MRELYYRMRRIGAWLPVLWRDRDWDYCFLLAIIKFKLNRMADCIEENDIMEGASKVAGEMREVVDHLSRYEDAMSYYPAPPDLPEWNLFGGDKKPSEIGPCPPKRREYYNMIHDKEQEHWDAAWKLVAEKGMGWWD